MRYEGTAKDMADLQVQINGLVEGHIKKHGIKLPFKAAKGRLGLKGKLKIKNKPNWLKIKED